MENERINDDMFRRTAERLVMAAGIRVDLKGFARMADAVILYGTGCYSSFNDLYESIGRLRKLKTKTVTRQISYAIAQSFDLAGRLSKMVGVEISPADIHNALVIAYLAKLFEHPDSDLFD